MSEYMPMKGPLPGQRYEPSNGTEGHGFLAQWCGTCARDRAMREGLDPDDCDDTECCEIIGASFRGEAVEWRELENGNQVCLAYVEAGSALPPPRRENTIDMFLEQAT